METFNSGNHTSWNLLVNVRFFVYYRQPPVNETHWMGLLQDILEMQQNVYTCIQLDTCYEVNPAAFQYVFEYSYSGWNSR